MTPRLAERADRSAIVRRLRGATTDDTGVADVAFVVGVFAAYLLLERTVRVLSRIEPEHLRKPFLLFEAVRAQPWAYLLVASVGSGVVLMRPSRSFSRWTSMDHGRALRWLALSSIAVLTWQGALYEYNHFLGQSHLADRLLLVVLAAAALMRPIFLVPFAIQSRTIANQLASPFGTRSAQNIDDLLVIAILALAAMHLMFVATGRRDTSPVLLVLSAAVATHFFVPGRSKLALGWVEHDRISNLPLAAYTAGWLGHTDGAWARVSSDALRAHRGPVLVSTLAIELGAVVAVAHYKLMRMWLIGAIGFHLALFALTGFWFLAWIALEVTLLVIFTRPALRRWVQRNATVPRGSIAVVAVFALGGTLFGPPATLVRLDAPVSHGYRIEATTVDGRRQRLPVSAFAPSAQDLAFMNLRVTERPVSGGYGYVGTLSRYRALEAVRTFDDLADLDLPASPADAALARDYLSRFLDSANERGRAPWSPLSPPDHFWTSAPAPLYDYSTPISTLDLFLLTSIHREGDPIYREELVLTVSSSVESSTTEDS